MSLLSLYQLNLRAAGGGSATASLNGSSATSAAGALSPVAAAVAALVGAGSTSAPGSFAPSAAGLLTLIGASAASAAGTVTASTSSGASAILVGASASSAAGSLVDAGSASVLMTGAACASAPGTITATGSTATSVPLSGVAGISAAGAIAPTADGYAILAGASSSSSVGVLVGGVSANASLTGAAASTGFANLFAQGSAAIIVPSAPAASVAGQVQAVGYISITSAQADVIARLAALHGIGQILTVGPTQRTGGDLVQRVSGTDTVTITTTAWGTTAFDPSLIDKLGLIYGLTAPLTVTAAGRSAGSLSQTFTSDGITTTVQ